MRKPPPDVAHVLVEGPWRHRLVAANGARFHIAEAGEGPLVVLLHGFAQFWWTWRHQIEPLAAAGYRVAAMDLRGYGASDKPPRGYDAATLTADVAGVVRALGEQNAVIIGQDWGAWIAWAMPTLQPRQTLAIAAVSMPHPLTLYREMATARSPRTTAQMIGYQVPWLPQRRLTKDGAVARLLSSWWGEGEPDADALDRYTKAVRLPAVADTSLNGLRWAVRGSAGRDARRFRDALATPISIPVLVVHGGKDTWVRPGSQAGSRRYVAGRYRSVIVPNAGHLIPETYPTELNDVLLEWLPQVSNPVFGLPPSIADAPTSTNHMTG